MSNERSGDLTVIDGDMLSVVATVPVGKRPRGIAVSRGGTQVLVALSGSPRLGPGVDPERARTLTADKAADGTRAFVPVEGKAEVAVIDVQQRRLLWRIPVPGEGAMPMCAVMSADGRELFVSTGRGNTIAVVDTKSQTVVANTAVGARPWGIALSPDGSRLYFGQRRI